MFNKNAFLSLKKIVQKTGINPIKEKKIMKEIPPFFPRFMELKYLKSFVSKLAKEPYTMNYFNIRKTTLFRVQQHVYVESIFGIFNLLLTKKVHKMNYPHIKRNEAKRKKCLVSTFIN